MFTHRSIMVFMKPFTTDAFSILLQCHQLFHSIRFMLKRWPEFGSAGIILLYVNASVKAGALGGFFNWTVCLEITNQQCIVVSLLTPVYQLAISPAPCFYYKSPDLFLFFLQDSQRLVNTVSYIKVLLLLIIVYSGSQRNSSSQKKSLSQIWPSHSSQIILANSLSLASLQRLLIVHVSEWGAAPARRKLDLVLVKGCIIGPCSCVISIGW